MPETDPLQNPGACGLRPQVTTSSGRSLELVVVFTTPGLTRAALEAAGKLGRGLNASVRLLKIQVTPWPLEHDESPVPLAFLEQQVAGMRCELPMRCEVRLARDFRRGLESALPPHSIVVLASPKRLWPTRNERLAHRLREAGRVVILVPELQNEGKEKPCST